MLSDGQYKTSYSLSVWVCVCKLRDVGEGKECKQNILCKKFKINNKQNIQKDNSTLPYFYQ